MAGIVAIGITLALWHYSLCEMPILNELKKDRAATGAAQEERDQAANHALAAQQSKQAADFDQQKSRQQHEAWLKQREIDLITAQNSHAMELEELRAKYQHAYDDAMRDVGTKYALYCPGCGKVMTLQHASRLPAEAQGQLHYVPPPEEEEDVKPNGRKRARS